MTRKDSNDEDDVIYGQNDLYSMINDENVMCSRTKLPGILIANLLNQNTRRRG